MKAEQIHPDLRWQFRFMPALPLRSKFMLRLTRLSLKTLSYYTLPDEVRLERVEVADGVSVDIYTPEQRSGDAALLWIHGGGLVLDRTGLDNRGCIQTAQGLGIVVISVTYRLAPEHPFPVPLLDCLEAWDWIQRVAPSHGIEPRRVAVGGQSAGGGLAASLAQMILDRGGVQPAALWLFCPMLDDRTASARHPGPYPLWDNKANRFGWSSYLGREPGADSVPIFAVPARATSLEGLPQTWLGTGDIELFHEEHREFAQALERAEVSCTLDVVAGGTHAFEMLANRTNVAQQYWARARSWLGNALVLAPAEEKDSHADPGRGPQP